MNGRVAHNWLESLPSLQLRLDLQRAQGLHVERQLHAPEHFFGVAFDLAFRLVLVRRRFFALEI